MGGESARAYCLKSSETQLSNLFLLIVMSSTMLPLSKKKTFQQMTEHKKEFNLSKTFFTMKYLSCLDIKTGVGSPVGLKHCQRHNGPEG